MGGALVSWVPGTRGVLFDVDGTLLLGEQAAPGAARTLTRLRETSIPFRLTTNTTRKSRGAVAQALRSVGIDVRDEEVLAPSVLARRRILDSGNRRALLLLPEEARVDFDGVDWAHPGTPDWVVVGDLGRGFNWEVLDRAFQALRGGARLLALQKNRAWYDGDAGLVLDAGPFVVALEYAAEVEAEIVGKPASAFFDLALAILGIPARDVLVVGDDLENDGRGAASAGCRSALVRTGKFSPNELANSGWRPDLLIENVGDLLPPTS
jgi:HAD superfamily hydrolase (TIGR01458 family)